MKNGNVPECEYEEIVESSLNDKNIVQENNKLLVNILKEESKRLMKAIGEQLKKSNFKPVAVEAWFGENGEYNAITLDSGIRIEGKIDRVDQFGEWFRVIDYKTGKIEENPESVYYGKKVQLLSYIQAIMDKNKKLKPAAALYFPVRNEWADSKKKAEESYKNKGYIIKDEHVVVNMDTDLLSNKTSKTIPVKFINAKGTSNPDERDFGKEGNLLTQEQFESITNYILEIEQNAVKEIMSGYIKPSPLVIGDKSPCHYCAYKSVCGLESTDMPDGRKAIKDIEFHNFL
jgi:ATP-dependent helicase/nuclease subunit B